MENRDYQTSIIEQIGVMLLQKRVCYLAAEMRTGKTYMSLIAAQRRSTNILFLTKKSAIPDVKKEIEQLGMSEIVHLTNYEQVSKLDRLRYSLVIIDEAHSLGAFPKLTIRTKKIKEICSTCNYVIFLSGTPSPESYSQLFHQFFILPEAISPVRNFKNFYAFAKEHVNVKLKRIGNARTVNDYSECKPQGRELFENYFVRLSQEDAGFKILGIDEQIIYSKSLYVTDLIETITRDKMLTIRGKEIICKTAADLFTKVHQISSGTLIVDSGAILLSLHKVQELKKLTATGLRYVIFTKFVAEETLLLKSRHCIEDATNDIAAFKRGDAKHFISNVAKASQGVDLSAADAIIFYNLDFSSKNFIQAKARLQAYAKTKKTKIIYLFTLGGLEEKVYESLNAKKSYTLSYFKADYTRKMRIPR